MRSSEPGARRAERALTPPERPVGAGHSGFGSWRVGTSKAPRAESRGRGGRRGGARVGGANAPGPAPPLPGETRTGLLGIVLKGSLSSSYSQPGIHRVTVGLRFLTYKIVTTCARVSPPAAENTFFFFRPMGYVGGLEPWCETASCA